MPKLRPAAPTYVGAVQVRVTDRALLHAGQVSR
jgi:hypothetical protein